MTRVAKIAAHLLFACGLLLLLVLPGNKYEWMRGMDAAVPLEEDSGDRGLFAALVLLIAVTAQLVIAARTTAPTERIVSIILAGVAGLLWVSKFG